MAIHGSLVASVLLSCFLATCYGVTFSSLQNTLVVTASSQMGQGNIIFFTTVIKTYVLKSFINSHSQSYILFETNISLVLLPKKTKTNLFQSCLNNLDTELSVLKARGDKITVTWSLSMSSPAGIDSTYKKVKVKLCYALISQQDRTQRKTEGELKRDKTCQHKIVSKPYIPSKNTYIWTVQKDVPTATYSMRAYVHNTHDEEAAYGQSTDTNKATKLSEVRAI